jgi:tRNA (mo5U34)-methyltransferase
LRTPDASDALRFIETSTFIWHQGFELAPGVRSPGASPIEWLIAEAKLPADTTGLSVLDIGATNGATAFELERRGAERVVAVDIYDEHRFGFRALADLFGSNAEFVQSSVYELPRVLNETFDLVIFWGVLYHLRHPLLAIDMVRDLTAGTMSLETAVAADPSDPGDSLVRFYRGAELGEDPSNWFAPTPAALADWVGSSGFDVEWMNAWPEGAPARALLQAAAAPGPAEFETVSYEQRLTVSTPEHPVYPTDLRSSTTRS